MTEISVPLEVIREGRSEEYADIQRKYNANVAELKSSEGQYAFTLRSLKGYLNDIVWLHGSETTLSNRGAEAWKTTSIIKGLSDRLFEYGGIIQECRHSIDSAFREMSKIEWESKCGQANGKRREL
jgi:hypothetical protein